VDGRRGQGGAGPSESRNVSEQAAGPSAGVRETYRSSSVDRLTTRLRRPGSGRKRVGIPSQVLRPMTTAFGRSAVAPQPSVVADQMREVREGQLCQRNASRGRTPAEERGAPRANHFISCGRRQGRPPPRPIPFDCVAATMSVRGARDVEAGMVKLREGVGWGCESRSRCRYRLEARRRRRRRRSPVNAIAGGRSSPVPQLSRTLFRFDNLLRSRCSISADSSCVSGVVIVAGQHDLLRSIQGERAAPGRRRGCF
jgi:hypothetical protein